MKTEPALELCLNTNHTSLSSGWYVKSSSQDRQKDRAGKTCWGGVQFSEQSWEDQWEHRQVLQSQRFPKGRDGVRSEFPKLQHVQEG